MSLKIVEGGITAAKGFEAAGVEANIKYTNRKDMALIYSKEPCAAAGTFTSNVVKAACVTWDQEIIKEGIPVNAVIINSGIANACTGSEGRKYCRETADEAAKAFDIEEKNVLVASTGEIGKQLPIDRIKAGVKKLIDVKSDTISASQDAAEAIMTTDTVFKQVAVEIELSGKKVTIGGMCKGSGMIHPNMSTMLAFVTTDAAISKELLQEALSTDVNDTYNMVSIDGDTSTNDTLIILANAKAGNTPITSKNEDYNKFLEALHFVNETLAKKIAGDGEGATALFETKVINADTKENAKIIAKSVICSSLTKAAIFGHDANWGRILCAMGYSGAKFDPEKIELFFESKSGQIAIYKDGVSVNYSEEEATKILSDEEVTVVIDMKSGDKSATAWGCDLSYEYVRINADYRT